MAAVARAGIPGAILPVAWDQPWWGEHLAKLKVGLNLGKMISSIDEDSLETCFRSLSADSDLAERAAELGGLIRQETSGRQRLADFVERSLELLDCC